MLFLAHHLLVVFFVDIAQFQHCTSLMFKAFPPFIPFLGCVINQKSMCVILGVLLGSKVCNAGSGINCNDCCCFPVVNVMESKVE